MTRPALPWHATPAHDVLSVVGSEASGLSDAEAARRLGHYGPNLLTATPAKSVWRILKPVHKALRHHKREFAAGSEQKRVGFAYVMNKLDFYLEDDPREKALRDAVYRAIARLSKASRVFPPTGRRLETALA